MRLFLMSINNFLYMSTSIATDGDLLSPQESILLDFEKNCDMKLLTASVPCNIKVLSCISEGEGGMGGTGMRQLLE